MAPIHKPNSRVQAIDKFRVIPGQATIERIIKEPKHLVEVCQF
jgi:hypothetical protein